MEIIRTQIEGLLILQPRSFSDDRGSFHESYNKELLKREGILDDFVQDNQSVSRKGVLRGLHFQKKPHAQAKLVRVARGKVLDVAVDIRKNSSTYGKHVALELDAEGCTMFYIPAGFAHGFLTLEENTVFVYKCSAYYNKASEETIAWNDPDLNISWKKTDPMISSKDKEGRLFRDLPEFF